MEKAKRTWDEKITMVTDLIRTVSIALDSENSDDRHSLQSALILAIDELEELEKRLIHMETEKMQD